MAQEDLIFEEEPKEEKELKLSQKQIKRLTKMPIIYSKMKKIIGKDGKFYWIHDLIIRNIYSAKYMAIVSKGEQKK